MASVTTVHNPSSVWGLPAENADHLLTRDRTAPRQYAACCSFPANSAWLLMAASPPGFPEQAATAMSNVEALLTSAGMTRAHLVKLNYYLTRPVDAPTLADIRRSRGWSSAEPPAVTAIVVSSLARPEYLIEIEAIAAA